jgi:tetratricopeptide (TPR) repeat protein
MPNGLDTQYNAVDMHHNLGLAFFHAGKSQEAIAHFSEAIRRDPNKAEAHYSLALALAAQRDLDGTLKHYAKAVQLKPAIDTSPALHHLIGMNYAEARRFREAVLSAEKALKLAGAGTDEKLVEEITKCLELYKQADNSSRRNGNE